MIGNWQGHSSNMINRVPIDCWHKAIGNPLIADFVLLHSPVASDRSATAFVDVARIRTCGETPPEG
jgi:hypothetical protein